MKNTYHLEKLGSHLGQVEVLVDERKEVEHQSQVTFASWDMDGMRGYNVVFWTLLSQRLIHLHHLSSINLTPAGSESTQSVYRKWSAALNVWKNIKHLFWRKKLTFFLLNFQSFLKGFKRIEKKEKDCHSCNSNCRILHKENSLTCDLYM